MAPPNLRAPEAGVKRRRTLRRLELHWKLSQRLEDQEAAMLQRGSGPRLSTTFQNEAQVGLLGNSNRQHSDGDTSPFRSRPVRWP